MHGLCIFCLHFPVFLPPSSWFVDIVDCKPIDRDFLNSMQSTLFNLKGGGNLAGLLNIVGLLLPSSLVVASLMGVVAKETSGGL